MKKYTVAAFFDDNQQIISYQTEADDETKAVANMRECEYYKDNLDNIMIVGIFKGHCIDMNECDSVSALQDWQA